MYTKSPRLTSRTPAVAVSALQSVTGAMAWSAGAAPPPHSDG